MLDKLPVNRHGGIIKLHDDIDAVWLINKKEESSELLLDLSWDCPANPSGFTHFNLNVSRPDPGQDNWGNTLNSLASRFHCY